MSEAFTYWSRVLTALPKLNQRPLSPLQQRRRNLRRHLRALLRLRHLPLLLRKSQRRIKPAPNRIGNYSGDLLMRVLRTRGQFRVKRLNKRLRV